MRTVTGLDMWSAPETRQESEYTEIIDSWGVGCVLYFLIMRHPPFVSPDEMRLQAMVQEGKYTEFSRDCLNFYSPELISLVRSMLQVDPAKRMTIDQAL